jgi:diadenosine tetraphosphate (Ap4A) HIT family hydrolase
MNETIRKFGYPDTLIHEYAHWVVLLRPQQVTLGSLVLACKDPAQQFHEVTAPGFAELGTAIRHIEQTLAELVRYRKMNYLMLMMVDPDVHFHVIPRYPDTRSLLGVEYRDAGWPGPPALDRGVDVDDKARDALVAALRQAWARSGA